MGKLNFIFKKMIHPYIEEVSSAQEMWGEIRLVWGNENTSIELINTQWNLYEAFEMFDRIKIYLNDSLPFKNENGLSIAELRDNLFSEDNFSSKEKENEYFDQLEDYFSFHTIRLRGTPTPLYYIGINNSCGEISRYDKISKSYLVFNFDMKHFIISTEESISMLLDSTI